MRKFIIAVALASLTAAPAFAERSVPSPPSNDKTALHQPSRDVVVAPRPPSVPSKPSQTPNRPSRPAK
jgi:hypothetical protein